jgi:hypothetical protein
VSPNTGPCMRALARRGHPTVPQLPLVAYLATAAAFAVLVSPFEDKGLSLGLILILAVVLAERAAVFHCIRGGSWARRRRNTHQQPSVIGEAERDTRSARYQTDCAR